METNLLTMAHPEPLMTRFRMLNDVALKVRTQIEGIQPQRKGLSDERQNTIHALSPTHFIASHIAMHPPVHKRFVMGRLRDSTLLAIFFLYIVYYIYLFPLYSIQLSSELFFNNSFNIRLLESFDPDEIVPT